MEESFGFQNVTEYEEPMVGSSLNSSRWQLEENIEGPVLASFLAIEFLLSVIFNLFIVLHTIHRGRKNLKKSSIFLLFILALTNLLLTLLYMPFTIIASGAREWIFGGTDFIRSLICQINGFIVIYLSTAAIHTLAVISIDRFLSIVKPDIHRRIMTWKTALGILILLWVLDTLVSLAPYYGSGLGEYNWSPRLGGCLAIFLGHRTYVLLQALHALVPISIIVVTSVWTLLSTRGFLKKHLKRQESTLNAEGFKVQKHIYSVRVKNLIGIFGTLLLFNFLSWMPYVIVSLIGVVIGLDKIPTQVYACGFILFLFSNVSNPLIQTYFRKDLLYSLRKTFCSYKDEHGTVESSVVSTRTLKRRLTSSSSITIGGTGNIAKDKYNMKSNRLTKLSEVDCAVVTLSSDNKSVSQVFQLEDRAIANSYVNEEAITATV